MWASFCLLKKKRLENSCPLFSTKTNINPIIQKQNKKKGLLMKFQFLLFFFLCVGSNYLLGKPRFLEFFVCVFSWACCCIDSRRVSCSGASDGCEGSSMHERYSNFEKSCRWITQLGVCVWLWTSGVVKQGCTQTVAIHQKGYSGIYYIITSPNFR